MLLEIQKPDTIKNHRKFLIKMIYKNFLLFKGLFIQSRSSQKNIHTELLISCILTLQKRSKTLLLFPIFQKGKSALKSSLELLLMVRDFLLIYRYITANI